MATHKIVSKLFQISSPSAALKALKKKSQFSHTHLRKLASIAGATTAWCSCDLRIKENVHDLCEIIVDELYVPYIFYAKSLQLCDSKQFFKNKTATPPLKYHKNKKFWSALSGSKTYNWVPDARHTFDAVVHFIQSSSGTGVHLGEGKVMTCAHVIDARDDDTLDDDVMPTRVGRKKIVMFSNGRVFEAICKAVEETIDGKKDVAVLSLENEIIIKSSTKSSENQLSSACLALASPEYGNKLFTVGNPSNIDLESNSNDTIEFEPPIFHFSVGRCEGYSSSATFLLRSQIAERGRAPTRGELKKLMPAIESCAATGVIMEHSCWTYWGHSGAPIFNDEGMVVGLHSSWCDRTGIRFATKLEHLQACLEASRAKLKGKTKKRKKNSITNKSEITKRTKVTSTTNRRAQTANKDLDTIDLTTSP